MKAIIRMQPAMYCNVIFGNILIIQHKYNLPKTKYNLFYRNNHQEQYIPPIKLIIPLNQTFTTNLQNSALWSIQLKIILSDLKTSL
jgi:hypothetical protein